MSPSFGITCSNNRIALRELNFQRRQKHLAKNFQLLEADAVDKHQGLKVIPPLAHMPCPVMPEKTTCLIPLVGGMES